MYVCYGTHIVTLWMVPSSPIDVGSARGDGHGLVPSPTRAARGAL
jgi:hypothetical protein